MPAERELTVSKPTYEVPTLIELKFPAGTVNALPTVNELAVIVPVLRDVIFAIPTIAVPALIELNAPPDVVKEPIEPLLIVPANNDPTVRLLNVPVPPLMFAVFNIPVVTVPALIELKVPPDVVKEPIEPLLIVPANNDPTVRLLNVPVPPLMFAVFNIPAVTVPALIELNAPAAVNNEPIEPLLIVPANREPTFRLLNIPVVALK